MMMIQDKSVFTKPALTYGHISYAIFTQEGTNIYTFFGIGPLERIFCIS